MRGSVASTGQRQTGITEDPRGVDLLHSLSAKFFLPGDIGGEIVAIQQVSVCYGCSRWSRSHGMSGHAESVIDGRAGMVMIACCARCAGPRAPPGMPAGSHAAS